MITSDFIVYERRGQSKKYKPIYKYQNGVKCLYCGSKMQLVKIKRNYLSKNEAMFVCDTCGIKCYTREYTTADCKTITPVADFVMGYQKYIRYKE